MSRRLSGGRHFSRLGPGERSTSLKGTERDIGEIRRKALACRAGILEGVLWGGSPRE